MCPLLMHCILHSFIMVAWPGRLTENIFCNHISFLSRAAHTSVHLMIQWWLLVSNWQRKSLYLAAMTTYAYNNCCLKPTVEHKVLINNALVVLFHVNLNETYSFQVPKKYTKTISFQWAVSESLKSIGYKTTDPLKCMLHRNSVLDCRFWHCVKLWALSGC